MSQHTEEQYQLSLDIAALQMIVAYSGHDFPPDALKQLNELNTAIGKKRSEIGLSVTSEELFNHISARYLTKH